MVEQPGPLDAPFGTDARLTRIANGDYSGNYLLFTVGLTVGFDALFETS